MRLHLLPDQPPEPPTVAELQRRIEDLPLGIAAIGRYLLSAPGVTADHLLVWAEACDEAAGEMGTLFRHGPEADGWAVLAHILRDATPRFPHPPREPAAAAEADAAILRHALAAGLATAGGGS